MIKSETISDLHEFENLRDEWNSLLLDSQSDSFFLTWEWLFTWWQFLAAKRALNVVLVRSGSRLVGILPLLRGPSRPLKFQPPCLEFIGGGSAGSDYLDFIVRSGFETEVLEHICELIKNDGRAVQLSHYLRDASNASLLLSSWKAANASSRERTINVCPFIDLKGHTWESYLATLGSDHRYNFRRRLKNIKSKFAMRLEVVQNEPERAAAVANLIHLHNLRRSSLNGSEAFNEAALCAFHDQVSRIALQRNWLRLYTLWLGDKPAASLYGFYYDRRFYFYQSGFDPSFREFSVGMVMMGLTIQCAIDEGSTEYDLLHGDEPYKFLWTKQVRPLARLELYPSGIKGRFWKSVRNCNDGMRQMARKMLSIVGAAREIPATTRSGGTVYADGRS